MFRDINLPQRAIGCPTQHRLAGRLQVLPTEEGAFLFIATSSMLGFLID